MYREGWVKLNSTPTHILSWGGYIDDNIESDTILLFIPGNPGITDFYYLFLETLYKNIGIPIWIINHAGCEPVPKDFTLLSIDQYPELYDMKGQIDHKKDFIKQYVPEGKKLILAGHSVGGKMCVELMKDEKISSRVLQAHLVFPTLEHIAESFNGKFYKYFFQHIIPLIVSLAWVFTLIPESCRRSILNLYFWMRRDWKPCHKDTCLEGVLKLFTPQGSKAALVLATDELHKIKDLDSEKQAYSVKCGIHVGRAHLSQKNVALENIRCLMGTIVEHSLRLVLESLDDDLIYETHFDKIYCYYAHNDDWAPLFQYHHLMETHPKVNGTIMDRKFTHAFVLTAPTAMAEELAKIIMPCIKT